MRNETIKRNKYIDAWESFIARNDEDTAQSRRDLRFTNATSGGAPKISTFGMCLSGAFSQGAMEILHHLAKENFPNPPTPDKPTGTATAIRLHVTMASQTGGCESFSVTYLTAWQRLSCQESEFARPMHQQP